MKTILNVLWFLLSGFWMAIGYAIAGIVACILIITFPIGVAAFRIAGYVVWPFGRTVIRAPDAGSGSAIGNVIWAVLFGWWLALGHLVTGVVLCITIIGIPAGVVSFKLIPLAFAPFGKWIVDTRSLGADAAPIVSA
jgi:uncharacterized membrane protein YccF (DUF307 family)